MRCLSPEWSGLLPCLARGALALSAGVGCASPTSGVFKPTPVDTAVVGADSAPSTDSAEDRRDTSGSDSAASDTAEPLPIATVEPEGSWCPEPAGALAYEDIAATLGLIDTRDGLGSRKEAGPVAALDLDGDGLDDILVGHRSQGLVLHRLVDGRFVQQTLVAARDLTGIALGDIDADGDLDIWTGGYSRRMWLLRNDGLGDDGWVFTDITAGSGLDEPPNVPQKTDASFGDFDGDGDLDLYVNRAGPPGSTEPATLDQLFMSHGDGTFTAVSEWFTVDQRQGVSWSPVWTDLDLDGDADLFVANADQASAGPSLLLENVGPGEGEGSWTFTDRSDSCFCTDNFNPMGVSSGDVDRDGDFDLFLTNTAADQLLRNEGDLTFVDVSRVAGDFALPTGRHMTFGSVWTDVDNDGWLDLFVSAGPLADRPDVELDAQPDRLLLNEAGTRLTNHAAALSIDSEGIGRGVTRARLDSDGYPELVVINLDGPSHIWHTQCLANRSLVVELRQDAENTRAIGAWVTVTFADGSLQRQEISAKPGWGGAMEPRAWFGLGEETAESVEVRWPDGETTRWGLPEDVDGRLVLTRD